MKDLIKIERETILKHCYNRYNYELSRDNIVTNKCNLLIVCISILLPFILSLSYYLLSALGSITLFRIELIIFSIILVFILLTSLIILFVANYPRNTVTFSSLGSLKDCINSYSSKDDDFYFKLECNNLDNVINSLAMNNSIKFKLISSAIILLLVFVGLCLLFSLIFLVEYFVI